jgi:hypothetical protein
VLSPIACLCSPITCLPSLITCWLFQHILALKSHVSSPSLTTWLLSHCRLVCKPLTALSFMILREALVVQYTVAISVVNTMAVQAWAYTYLRCAEGRGVLDGRMAAWTLHSPIVLCYSSPVGGEIVSVKCGLYCKFLLYGSHTRTGVMCCISLNSELQPIILLFSVSVCGWTVRP